MKYTIKLLLLVALLAMGGVATLRPVLAQELPPAVAALQTAFADREAAYQTQLAQLQQAFTEHQTTYQQQLAEMNQRQTQTQAQAQQLANHAQTLQAQIAQLQAVRAQRQAQYQSQLETARTQYGARAAVINNQLVEVQARLAEANAMLGR